MKLLSIETCTKTYINGYVDDGYAYRSFELKPDSPPTFGPPLLKTDYRSLFHFAGVIGKFDPYAFIWIEPTPIDNMTFDSIRKIIKKRGFLYNGMGNSH